MNKHSSVSYFAALALMLELALVPTRAASADIWLSGEDPVVQKDKHKDNPADYMDMFKPDAPWLTSSSALKAFKISTQLTLRGTDEQLRTIIDDLSRRHIAIAIELGLLEGSDRCGNIEGYGGKSATIERIAQRIKNLGGQIDYVAMDETVWFGHIFKEGSGGRVGCQFSVAQLVDQIVPKIAILRQSFPSIQIGDIEPINAKYGGPQSINDYIEFEHLLRQKTGGLFPVFVHADISWSIVGWEPLLADLATRLHAEKIRFGVICDGDENVGGDKPWVEQALQRCKAIAANPKTKPDDFIVQTWERLPTKMLPESDSGTLTYEVKQAAALFR